MEAGEFADWLSGIGRLSDEQIALALTELGAFAGRSDDVGLRPSPEAQREGEAPTDEGERVGAELSRFLDAFQRQPAAFGNPAAGKRFRDEILSMLLELFNPHDADKRDVTHATYAEIVQRSERILQERVEEPQTVLDLCVALRCSRRTLQTSFQRVANVTPIEYLRSVRLNGVRRLLRSTSQDELMVGDAAAQWGFTHPSYFAREYRDLFGELPSQTPRKG